jgi:hypothetical protein
MVDLHDRLDYGRLCFLGTDLADLRSFQYWAAIVAGVVTLFIFLLVPILVHVLT